MNRAIFPGSFDPITLGHVDIIKRAISVFDEIIVGIGINNEKKHLFNNNLRIKFIEDTFKKEPKIKVKNYKGLTINFCKKNNINTILRGIRNPSDFEFEKAIAHTNYKLSGIETVFLITNPEFSYISSSIVREIIENNGNYKKLVPKTVRI
ncbi:MAG: pantetheine-phosphate adenylyltransferase [Flavobacteriaceae bacterium]|nr:pantetheine-phosphate adenylyltransferase [Flavobacteriaceae bacterium]